LFAASSSGSSSSKKPKGYDREFVKAERFLEAVKKRKDDKKVRMASQALEKKKMTEDYAASAAAAKNSQLPGKNFATQTVWGQNVITCRDFSLDTPKKYDFLGSYTSAKSAPIHPSPEVAFLGRSNVGKSSLLNTLTGLNKKIAVESKTPGRTQCINMFKCHDKEGDIAVLVDLPGYGFAKIAKTQQDEISGFLRDYLTDRGALRLVVLLVDSRREVQDLDLGMYEFLEEEGLQTLVVATKVDKLSKNEAAKSLGDLRKAFKLPSSQPIPFSSVTGQGRRELWRALRSGIIGTLETAAVEGAEVEGSDDSQEENEASGDYDLEDL